MNLYKNLSHVYHKMYQSFFDYDKEFDFHKTILDKYDCQKVIEYGCGTGNLAQRFLESKFDYLGVDLNKEMLDIASQNLSKDNFVQGDMKSFETSKKFDIALITGRTISYLTTNKETVFCFKNIAKNLREKGILIFDAIDANQLFQDFDETKKEIEVGDYKRISYSKSNLETGWTWDWYSEYYEQKNSKYELIGQDHATVRAFTKDEIKLFLTTAGFELLEVISKDTYMWKDHYFVSRKR